jgi:hypothetical protein
MQIRAKFKCMSVEKQEGCEIVKLFAVNSADGKGNESWAKWTPSGNLQMTINAEGAVDVFKPGDVYFLDFTRVE